MSVSAPRRPLGPGPASVQGVGRPGVVPGREYDLARGVTLGVGGNGGR